MTQTKKHYLLPTGFQGFLPPKAGVWVHLMHTLTRYFEEKGYAFIMPPLMEFEDSLFSGAGKGLERCTFRVMDPQSHKMMGIRPDITVQVGRIATTILAEEPRPLKLSYAGQVLRIEGEGLYKERELTQAGIELIGSGKEEAEVEVLSVVIGALRLIGIEGITVDFTLPPLAVMLLAMLGLPPVEQRQLEEALKKKDRFQIAHWGGKYADIFQTLVAPDVSLAVLSKLPLPEEGKKYVKQLERIITKLRNVSDAVDITIDPLGATTFAYYSGVAFSLFSKNAASEVGRGGRYTLVHNSHKQEEAIGFTLYGDVLLRALGK